MTKTTYLTDDGAIHEYTKKKDPVTPESIGAELEEIIPDGINIHISGTDISRISNIEIYFKEDE